MHELRRIFLYPRRWLILLLIAAVNLALFAGYCRTVPDMTEQEQTAYETYLNGGYAEYLERVSAQSDEQALLGTLRPAADFVSRNLQKTRQDYAKLTGTKVTAGENRGLRALADFHITDYLLLIAPLLLAVSFASERRTEITALLRTAKNGRTPLTLWRIAALMLLSTVSAAVLFGSDLIFAHGFFGDPGYARALQSSPDFQLCAHRVTVGGYLLRITLLKMCAAFLIAMAVWLLWGMLYTLAAAVCSGLLLGSQLLFWRLILPTSTRNLLKFCNLFAMLSPETFYLRYANLNLFGYPRGFLACMGTAGIVFGLLCTALCIILLGLCRPVTLGAAAAALADRFAKWKSRFLPRRTLIGYEARKMLISEGGIFVLAAAVLWGFSLSQTVEVSLPLNYRIERLYNEYEGEITPEKREACQKEIDRYAGEIEKLEKKIERLMQDTNPDVLRIGAIEEEISRLREWLDLYTAFADRMDALTAYSAETGYGAWLVRQNGWSTLFSETAQVRRCCTALLIVLVFLFAPVMAYENRFGTRPLIRSLRRGRGGVQTRKLLLTAILLLAAAAGFYAVYFAALQKTGMLVFPEAPVHSVDILRFAPLECTLRTAAAGLFLVRYLAAFAAALIVLGISRLSKNPQAALLTALAVLLLPAALAELGLPVPDPVHLLCVSVQ